MQWPAASSLRAFLPARVLAWKPWPRAMSLGLAARLVEGLLGLAVVCVSLATLWKLAALLGIRVPYPYEFEWEEGMVLDHVRRILLGKPLYAEPSLEFTAAIYPPFYYFVVALFTKFFGLGFFAARVVSTTASLAVHLLIAGFIWRETRSAVAALVGAALFATTFPMSGAWFDLARVDSLYLALLLGGCYVVRFQSSMRSGAVAGVLFALSFFTKQAALSLAVPALVYAVLADRSRGLRAAQTFALVAVVLYGVLDLVSSGWARFYLFTIPSEHEVRWQYWRAVLFDHFWFKLSPYVFLALAALAGVLPGRGMRVWLFYAGLFGGAAVSAMVMMLHQGGFDNVFMAYHALTCLLAGVSLGALQSESRTLGVGRPGVLAHASALVALTFSDIDFNQYRPSDAEREASRSVIEAIRELPAPTCVTSTGFYAAMAGHQEFCIFDMSIWDVITTPSRNAGVKLGESYLQAIKEQRWKAIVVGAPHTLVPMPVWEAFHRYYRLERRIAPTPVPPRLKLEEIWVPVIPPPP